MTFNEIRHLISEALNAGMRASVAIMEVYNTPFGYDNKADGSPITLADRRSNLIISEALKTTGIPVISEEGNITNWADRRHWSSFWLVDPLDGTKEFISRNGEFAINIALVHNNSPIAGIIISPVSGKAWWGILGAQAFCIDAITLSGEINAELLSHISKPIIKQPASQSIRVSVSRSHIEPQTLNLAEQIRKKLGNVELIEKGSALKFCDLIEGRSHLYVRYSPTWEWDTAAGHALLLAQSGEVFNINTLKPLQYNKHELGNPGFIAFASKQESVRYFSELSF